MPDAGPVVTGSPCAMKTLIVATRNTGKLTEIRQILGPGIQLKSLADIPDAPDIIEDGHTFEANAIKKARVIARHTGLPALGDDSGLEVDALDGAPGVYSARFSGPNATDETNNSKLLRLLKDVPAANRTARFRCVIAIAAADGTVQTADGACEGLILNAPRGRNGFGYDPVFFVPDKNLTFAELPAREKNRISHRGRALKAVEPLIRAMQ